jgi:peptidoglycan LD-endopeptidase LytH
MGRCASQRACGSARAVRNGIGVMGMAAAVAILAGCAPGLEMAPRELPPVERAEMPPARAHLPPPPLLGTPVMPALIVPVAGIAPHQLRDTFTESRGAGRPHNAIDIHAPRGTPVLAAADGIILRLHQGDRGGLAIYHLDPDGRTRYYYAHLDSYAEGLREGQRVRLGEVIGYVGDTGNAAPGDYHLHFSIAILDDVSRWWEGRSINPYPILVGEVALGD